eukprot:g297.t1
MAETAVVLPKTEELVEEHFAFDYAAWADSLQLMGDDLFGVLAPRDLQEVRPTVCHEWMCRVCGYGNNLSNQPSCAKCGRERDPGWLQIPGADGDGGQLLELGKLVQLSANASDEAGCPAVVTRIDRLKQEVHFFALPAEVGGSKAEDKAVSAPLATHTLRASELAARVLALHRATDPRGRPFLSWFRCAECELMTSLANGHMLFMPPKKRGNMEERARLLQYEVQKAEMAKLAAQAEAEKQAVLDLSDEMKAKAAELHVLRKQLAKPQPWCVHCGWEPRDPTSRPGYEWTKRRR